MAAYLLENAQQLFKDSRYNGIYRDDGINVINGKRSTEQMVEWLDSFQAQVNKLTGSEHLKFTLDIWNPDSPEEETPSNKRVTIKRNSAFPYLDMEFYWLQDELQFRVHLKPNQLLKYLNKGSTHTNSCFNSISHGVIRSLTAL